MTEPRYQIYLEMRQVAQEGFYTENFVLLFESVFHVLIFYHI